MNKTILLVDDDENDVFFMKRAMKQAEMINPLQVVEDGQQAIDYLSGRGDYADRERFPLPCLVLLDLKLPEVMGFEVLKWIRQQSELKTLIVVVLTSSNLGPDIDLAYRLGANSYLVKPPTPEKLLAMVAAIKQYWLGVNQPAPDWAEFARPVG
jgi:CheY-like chemotaxis protein